VMNAPFRRRQLAWLVAAALAAPGVALGAPAGQVDFAIGGVTVTGADGRTRPGTRGLALENGDRIVTSDGRAQIRFTDGAYVSLQPNTDFAIRDYRYDGKTDGSERGVFGLVRGALRTVTGAIGRVNRGAYQIQTPTATIGIRGTGGLIQVLASGTTLIVSSSGIWTLTNAAGTLDLPAGTAGEATPDQTQRPRETARGPEVPAPPPGPLEVALLPRPEGPGAVPPNTGVDSSPFTAAAAVGGAGGSTYVSGDAVSPAGVPVPLTQSTPSFTELPSSSTTPATPPATPPLGCSAGCELAYGSLDMPSVVTVGAVNAVPATGGPVVLSGTNVVSFVDGAGVTYASTGPIVESGQADNIVTWSRWTGSATLSGSPWPGFVTLANVAGLPSPIADLTSTTATFTYNLVGWTAPTNGAATGTVTGGQLVGHFGANPMVDIVNFSLTVGANAYSFSQAGIPVPTGGPFAPFAAGGIPVTGSCVSGCLAEVKGHFMGAGATHAGFAYKVNNPFDALNPDTVGAAAFKR
jgi:hypothetical protein